MHSADNRSVVVLTKRRHRALTTQFRRVSHQREIHLVAFNTNQSCWRITVEYFQGMDSNAVVRSCQEAFNLGLECRDNVVIQDNLKTMFQVAAVQSLETQRMWRTRDDVKNAQTALALAHWTVLAWRTKWVEKLCSYGVRHTLVRNNESSIAFRAVEPHPCFSPGLDSRKHLLLGIVLAELAIGCPISVTIEGENLLFYIFEHGLHQTIDLTKLMMSLRRSTSNRYQTAVIFCLEWDERKERRDVFRAEDLWRYNQRVLEP